MCSVFIAVRSCKLSSIVMLSDTLVNNMCAQTGVIQFPFILKVIHFLFSICVTRRVLESERIIYLQIVQIIASITNLKS